MNYVPMQSVSSVAVQPVSNTLVVPGVGYSSGNSSKTFYLAVAIAILLFILFILMIAFVFVPIHSISTVVAENVTRIRSLESQAASVLSNVESTDESIDALITRTNAIEDQIDTAIASVCADPNFRQIFIKLCP